MLAILGVTAPIYALVGLGYLFVRFGPMTTGHVRGLGVFVVQLALPCLVFTAVSTREVADLVQPTYLVAYAAGSVTAFALAWGYGRWIERAPRPEWGWYGLGSSGCNSGFVGYPVNLLVIPAVADVALSINVVVENLVVIPLALAVAAAAAGHALSPVEQVLATARRLATHPMVLALLAGLIVSILRLPLPGVVTRTTTLLAQASLAVALFAVGGGLVGLSLRGRLRPVVVLSAGKLALQPALVALALWVLTRVGAPDLDAEMRVALILTAALPGMSIYPVLAGSDAGPQAEATAATVLLTTTVASFVTLSLLIYLLGVRPA